MCDISCVTGRESGDALKKQFGATVLPILPRKWTTISCQSGGHRIDDNSSSQLQEIGISRIISTCNAAGLAKPAFSEQNLSFYAQSPPQDPSPTHVSLNHSTFPNPTRRPQQNAWDYYFSNSFLYVLFSYPLVPIYNM